MSHLWVCVYLVFLHFFIAKFRSFLPSFVATSCTLRAMNAHNKVPHWILGTEHANKAFIDWPNMHTHGKGMVDEWASTSGGSGGHGYPWDVASGQPNDCDGPDSEPCIFVGPNGNWFDFACDRKTAPGTTPGPEITWTTGVRKMYNLHPLCMVQISSTSTSINTGNNAVGAGAGRSAASVAAVGAGSVHGSNGDGVGDGETEAMALQQEQQKQLDAKLRATAEAILAVRCPHVPHAVLNLEAAVLAMMCVVVVCVCGGGVCVGGGSELFSYHTGGVAKHCHTLFLLTFRMHANVRAVAVR